MQKHHFAHLQICVGLLTTTKHLRLLLLLKCWRVWYRRFCHFCSLMVCESSLQQQWLLPQKAAHLSDGSDIGACAATVRHCEEVRRKSRSDELLYLYDSQDVHQSPTHLRENPLPHSQTKGRIS